MPSKQVTIQGVMTWDEGEPPSIWGGGNVPMPTPPIHIPPTPPIIWGPPGPWPTPPIHLPPGVGSGNPPIIWGPPGPWPTPPIANVPGAPGYNPNPPGFWGPPGPWVTPPIHIPPGQGGPVPLPPGGSVMPPAANVPIDGKLVWTAGYGWLFVPTVGGEAGSSSPETTPETPEPK